MHFSIDQYHFCTTYRHVHQDQYVENGFLFISRFGAIVSQFVRGDIFLDSPCSGPKNLQSAWESVGIEPQKLESGNCEKYLESVGLCKTIIDRIIFFSSYKSH